MIFFEKLIILGHQSLRKHLNLKFKDSFNQPRNKTIKLKETDFLFDYKFRFYVTSQRNTLIEKKIKNLEEKIYNLSQKTQIQNFIDYSSNTLNDIEKIIGFENIKENGQIMTKLGEPKDLEWLKYQKLKDELKINKIDQNIPISFLVTMSCKCQDFNLMFKLMDHIYKNALDLFLIEEYKVLIKYLFELNRVEIAFKLWNGYIKKHPQFYSEKMRVVAFYFCSKLVKTEFNRGLNLFSQLMKEFDQIKPEPTNLFFENLYWLRILCVIPNFELLQKQTLSLVNNLHIFPNSKIDNPLSQIVHCIIQGLVTSNKINEAIQFLSYNLFNLKNTNCVEAFKKSLFCVFSVLVQKGHVAKLKNLLLTIKPLLKSIEFPIEKKIEILLQAYSNSNCNDLNVTGIIEKIKKFNIVPTDETWNALLKISSRESSFEQTLKLKNEFMQDYGFVPTVETYKILMSFEKVQNDIYSIFLEACSMNMLDADIYGYLFEKYYKNLPINDSNLFRLKSMIEQLDASRLKWTQFALFSALDTLRCYQDYNSMVYLFQFHFEKGSTLLNSSILNSALFSAFYVTNSKEFIQNLFSKAQTIFSLLTRPLDLPEEPAQLENSFFQISASNSSIQKFSTNNLNKKSVLALSDLHLIFLSQKALEISQCSFFYPNLIPDHHSFFFISKVGLMTIQHLFAMQEDPYKLIPTFKTYQNLLKFCINKDNDVISIINGMIKHHSDKLDAPTIYQIREDLRTVKALHLYDLFFRFK